MDSVEDLKKQRAFFLHEVYKMSKASTIEMVDGREIGDKLGFNEKQFVRTIYYLFDEGLLELGTSNQAGITHEGIKEVEQALENPEESTEHFPANVYVNIIENMSNSGILQGTVNSEQNITINQQSKNEINQILDEILSRLNEIDDVTLSNDIRAEIETIKSQLKSSNPKKSIIKSCLDIIKEIGKNVSTNTLSSLITSNADRAFDLL